MRDGDPLCSISLPSSWIVAFRGKRGWDERQHTHNSFKFYGVPVAGSRFLACDQMQHTHSCTACFLQLNSLSPSHTQTLISLSQSRPQAHVFFYNPSAPPFIPSPASISSKLHSACTKLSFVQFFDNNAVCFPRGRAERRCLAASLPRSPVSPACHPLCVCSDVWRALSAKGLCLFWAALDLIMAHYWGTRGS